MTFEVHIKLPEKSYQVAVLAKNAALFVMSFVDKRERETKENLEGGVYGGAAGRHKKD